LLKQLAIIAALAAGMATSAQAQGFWVACTTDGGTSYPEMLIDLDNRTVTEDNGLAVLRISFLDSDALVAYGGGPRSPQTIVIDLKTSRFAATAISFVGVSGHPEALGVQGSCKRKRFR
jgi:hypothetical protein